MLLTPLVVVSRILDQLEGGSAAVTGLGSFFCFGLLPDDGTSVGRSVNAHMIVRNDGLQALAADVDFHVIFTLDGRMQVSQTDGALGRGLQDLGGQAGAFLVEVGNHGTGGDPANFLTVLVDGHAGADNAAVNQADGHDALGQIGDIFEVVLADTLVGSLLLQQSFLTDEVTLLLVEADGELCQRHGEDGDILTGRILAHFMAVQRQSGFQTQGVTSTQTGRLGAQLDQTVPQPGSVFALDIDFVAQRLAGVTGLGNAGQMAFQLQGAQSVLDGLGQSLTAGQGFQHLTAQGALNSDGSPVGSDIGDLYIELFSDGQQVSQVLFGVGSIDDQQEVVFLEHIQVGVVDGIAVFIGDDAVLRGIQLQSQNVAGQNILQELDALGAFDQQAAHMRHVEQAAVAAGVQMLCNDAGGILDGHFPAAEIHHGSTGCHMDIKQLGSLQFTHVFLLHLCVFYRKTRTKKAQNTPLVLCASVSGLRDSPAPAPGCTFGVHICTLQSFVPIRSFCLRAFAFPFGAACTVSPESFIRTLSTFSMTERHKFTIK